MDIMRAFIGVLVGLIYDGEGRAMVLTHTQKGNRRFHYYANRYETLDDNTASRVSARDIENIVVDQLSQTLASGSQMQSMLLHGSYTSEQLHNVISRCGKVATELGVAKYAWKQELLLKDLLVNMKNDCLIEFDGMTGKQRKPDTGVTIRSTEKLENFGQR
jgi:hypothetical protein